MLDIEETFLYDKTHGIIHVSEPDVVWTSPHYLRNKSYLETIYRSPVEICPYIWEPDFVTKEFSEGEVKGVPDIYVMEPSIGVMKNALIPLCIISRLYQKNPNMFGKAIILNGNSYKDKKFFINNIVANLPGLSSNVQKVYFSGRATFDEVFTKNDILLGHHWENGLNYLYLEALYKGVRLVHNSEYMKQVGFYYSDCEIDQGMSSAIKAINSYKQGYSQSTKYDRDFLKQFSIHNKSVQLKYKKLLSSVLGSFV